MSNNQGTSKGKFLIGCAAFFGIFLIIAVITISTILGFRSSVVALENKIEAQHTSNKSNHDAMWKKFKELTQVTDIQAEQFKDVYTGVISGRYQDSDLLFKAVSEQNPSLGTEVYTTLQREISASRNTFDNNQNKLIDVIREYNTRIDSGVGFLVNFIFNYEHIDPNQYIVTSDRTTDAFESNKDDVINLTGE